MSKIPAFTVSIINKYEIYKWPYHDIELTLAVVSLFIFNMHLVFFLRKPYHEQSSFICL